MVVIEKTEKRQTILRARFVHSVKLGVHDTTFWSADKHGGTCEPSVLGLVFDMPTHDEVVPWANVSSMSRQKAK